MSRWEVEISRPEGLKYRDQRIKKDYDHIFGVVMAPADWQPEDSRPAIMAYGSGWNGFRTGSPYGTIGAGKYAARSGVVTLSTNYRPGLEAAMSDGSSAVRYLRQHAKELVLLPIGSPAQADPLRQIMLSTTLIPDRANNPWDDMSISKACQYHWGWVAVPSRRKTLSCRRPIICAMVCRHTCN